VKVVFANTDRKLIMRGIDMSRALKASKVMSLCAIMLGLMAFSASLAQAEPNAHWNINKAELKSPLLPEIQVTELENREIILEGKKETKRIGILLMKIGLSTLEILCTGITLIDALLHELGRATGKVLFSGCTVDINKKHAPECTPKSSGEPIGSILTNKLEGLIKLHILKDAEGKEIGKDDLLKVLPEAVEGKEPPFVVLDLGATCIFNQISITGTVYLKDCKNLGLVEEVEHLFEEGPLTELLFGANKMTLDGSAKVALAGAHKGLAWSGIAA
jgi:hypothetical protein